MKTYNRAVNITKTVEDVTGQIDLPEVVVFYNHSPIDNWETRRENLCEAIEETLRVHLKMDLLLDTVDFIADYYIPECELRNAFKEMIEKLNASTVSYYDTMRATRETVFESGRIYAKNVSSLRYTVHLRIPNNEDNKRSISVVVPRYIGLANEMQLQLSSSEIVDALCVQYNNNKAQ